MNILVLNGGSSSLKYQLFNMTEQRCLAKGVCERIGSDEGKITHKTFDGGKIQLEKPIPSHSHAFADAIELLSTGEHKVISSLKEIHGVGHRVLHGKEKYSTPVIIDNSVEQDIESFFELGPLHLPMQLATIKSCRSVLGDVPMVAVFDTAFHQSMPPRAYIFPIPTEYYSKYGVRRYGFHGTSHRYVTGRYFAITGRGAIGSKIISCHLGNGSSICAVKDGKSIDTTMGFTPLDGLIMGTRCGGIDPSIVTFLQEKEGFSPKEMDKVLNNASGFCGISGLSSDLRDIEAAAQSGETLSCLTLEILIYQIKKCIGEYAAAMNGVDAIIFTGGIGENSQLVRLGVCSDMEFLGLEIDSELARNPKNGLFSTASSAVSAYVIPTDEELLIAKETAALIGG